jgi:hypothetical protein
MLVRIFKTKTLARFTRQNGIPDASLVAAVERARRGLIDADLGGRIIKQRVARKERVKEEVFACLLVLVLTVLSSFSASPRMNVKISRMQN